MKLIENCSTIKQVSYGEGPEIDLDNVLNAVSGRVKRQVLITPHEAFLRYPYGDGATDRTEGRYAACEYCYYEV